MTIIVDEVVPARRPWGHVVRQGEILQLVDLEGQQAVDFLCFDAKDPRDRYSATNTIKMQGNIYLGLGTVLYSDCGHPLFTLVSDTCGRHDTIYGCAARRTISCATACAEHPIAMPISVRSWQSSVSTSARSSAM